MNLKQLTTEFSKMDLNHSMQLDKCTYISNVQNTVNSLILTLQSQPKNRAYLPYFNLLKRIYENKTN